MAFTQGTPTFSFDHQAAYRIRVEGRVDPSWSDRLAGMAIRAAVLNQAPPTTTLTGALSDQAALAGVLRTLYDLHCTVLLVERLSPGQNAVNEAAQ